MRRKRIAIAWGIPDKAPQPLAYMCGPLALHKGYNRVGQETESWTITHVPTGRLIGELIPSWREGVKRIRLLNKLLDWHTIRTWSQVGPDEQKARRILAGQYD